jgi:hypothetical protein
MLSSENPEALNRGRAGPAPTDSRNDDKIRSVESATADVAEALQGFSDVSSIRAIGNNMAIESMSIWHNCC